LILNSLDLADLDSVKSFAQEFRTRESHLDVLVNEQMTKQILREKICSIESSWGSREEEEN